MNPLTNKTALITGSTSGIGLGIAHALAAEGANIILNGFGETSLIDGIKAELSDTYRVTVTHDGADCAHAAEVTRMVQDSGGVDILVNNAGIQHVASIEEFPLDKFEAIIAINMTSNWYAIRAALPHMKQRGWGRIINISSAHGLTASPFKSAYIMAKHGVVGLTKAVALEVAKNKNWDITANAICPGYTSTPLVEAQLKSQMDAHDISRDEVIANIMLDRQPQGEFVTVEEIGGVATFLCTPSARKITGTAISIDGGWTAM